MNNIAEHQQQRGVSRRDFLRRAFGLGAGLVALSWHGGAARAALTEPAPGEPGVVDHAPNVTLYRWHTDAVRGWQQQLPAASDPPQTRMVLLSSEAIAHVPFHTAIPSWAAQTPPGTWIEVQLRAAMQGRWSRFYRMMTWDSSSGVSRRTSFAPQADGDGAVAIDSLRLNRPAERVQARVLLCSEQPETLPTLNALNICMSSRQSGPGCPVAPVPPLPQTGELAMPLFSQLDYAGGAGWCSPTSLAMVLGYWHYQTGDARLTPFIAPDAVPRYTAPMVYDPHYKGNGNWSFNTAYAATLGLDACVTQFDHVGRLAGWLAAGIPVICSLAWQPGELDGASGASSDGHLIVVVGLRSDGWVEVADPSGTGINGGIRRSYRADQFTACWQCSSAGTVYIIHPHEWATPPLGTAHPSSVPSQE